METACVRSGWDRRKGLWQGLSAQVLPQLLDHSHVLSRCPGCSMLCPLDIHDSVGLGELSFRIPLHPRQIAWYR